MKSDINPYGFVVLCWDQVGLEKPWRTQTLISEISAVITQELAEPLNVLNYSSVNRKVSTEGNIQKCEK